MEKIIGHAKNAIKNWWISVIIGLLALALGVWCLFTPFSTFISLTYLFVALFLASGLIEIIYAVSNRNCAGNWGWCLAGGVVDLLFGILLLVLPTTTVAIALIYFVGFWIMFRSVWGIGISVDLKRDGLKDWGWLLALSILSLIFSFLFFINPVFGGLTISIFVSIAFIIYGIFRIYLGFKLKSVHKFNKNVQDKLKI